MSVGGSTADSGLDPTAEPATGSTAAPSIYSERGLTAAEVAERRADGLANVVDQPTSRSLIGILRANTLTRFNAIITALVVVVLAVGEPIDAVFGLVMVINSSIGIVQELRAKRSLDALNVLLTPSIAVVRDQVEVSVDPEELVLDDLVALRAGDQIPVDGSVETSDGLEVDESALTGESEPVPKEVGDKVLSGSFVASGVGMVTATAVGAEAWAHRLTSEAKEFALTRSELRVGIDRLLLIASWILVPLAALLTWGQLRSDASPADAVIASVAGVVALIPQGLVLLVSMAMAVAVIRLGQRNVVVQELPAVEGLARIDVLCVDKTGTLTTGNLTVEQVRAVGSADGADSADSAENADGASGADSEVRAGLAALSGLDAARSSTMDAIRSSLAEEDPGWPLESVVPFSSVRKWSSATFAKGGTWVLGAPEILLDAIQTDTSAIEEELRSLVDQALRVLLVGRANSEPGDGTELPSDLRAVGLVALSEELRADAAETIDYFRRQHVEVKIVSGDNPRTVAAVAERLGIESTSIDLRSVEDSSAIATDASVFGRVRPEQKRNLVQQLQAAGHTVAMTGDGVNDIPSLKAADIGIAMNTATPATKATAQLVLLDGRFERLPGVVSEGRRVIANMERVSSLFATKTVYAAVLALVFGTLGTTFPFLPRHLTVVATITIGIPAFVLSFRSSDEPCRPGYLRRVLHFAVPAGLTASGSTIAVFLIARSSLTDATLAEARTVATSTLTITGLWILYRLIRPLDRLEAGLLGGLILLFVATLAVPITAELYALDLPPAPVAAVAGVGVIATLAVLEVALTFADRRHRAALDS